MQESARAALSWVRANAWRYGIAADVFAKSDVHVHVPSGAAPKDGPSAGIVLVTALVSAFSERPVRPLVAMSGEITLSGAILPIGGVHEKVLAARRNGVREVVLPARNEDGVAELDEEIRRGLVFRFVSTIEEGVALAFGEPPEIDTRRARDERTAFAGATPIAAENAPRTGGTRLD